MPSERQRDRDGVARRETILVVDDQPDVAETAADILALSGYAVDVAHSASAALEIMSRGEAIDFLFLDIGMRAGMSGLELAGVVRERFPRVAVLLTSGYGDALAEAKAAGFETLLKPYFVESLRAAIRRLRGGGH